MLFIEVRDLVRMDIALNGARFIMIGFTLATVLAAVIAVRSSVSPACQEAHYLWCLPGYFSWCGLNSLTFLFLALSIVRRGDRGLKADYNWRVAGVYGLWAFGLILVPLVFPLLAVRQRV